MDKDSEKSVVSASSSAYLNSTTRTAGMPSGPGAEKMSQEDEKKRGPVKGPLFYGGLCAFSASLLLLVAFSSPYWLKSYDIAYLEFKSMGLWEFCFDNFHYPHQQENIRFTGCDYVFSFGYRAIREWMLPDWLQIVQTFFSVSFMLSYFALVIVALVMMKFPLRWWKMFEYEMIAAAFFSILATVIFMSLGLIIFGAKSWDRRWLMYPQYNYFSWSFYMAVFSLALHAIACLLLLLHGVRLRRVRHLRPRAYQMRPTSLATTLSYQYRFPSAPSMSPSPYPQAAASQRTTPYQQGRPSPAPHHQQGRPAPHQLGRPSPSPFQPAQAPLSSHQAPVRLHRPAPSYGTHRY